jgi:hypothetical protein
LRLVVIELIFLDHAFEMLLKAAILQKGGSIRERRARETIGFDACVRRALSDGVVKFLTEEQTLVLQANNGLRDAAQHHLLEISEGQLYMHAQAGVTLFRDILGDVFDRSLKDYLPERVLPVSTSPPTDLTVLFDSETDEIRKLLGPGRRRRIEAAARLRPLAILDSTIKGQKTQPSAGELGRIGRDLLAGKSWQDLFQGVSAITLTVDTTGPSLALRFSKKEGVPLHVVPEGTPGASVVGVKRVDELSFYNLGAKQLAEKVGLTTPKLVAVVHHLDIQNDPDCYKEIKIGKSIFKRYSQKAIDVVKAGLEATTADKVWQQYRERNGAVT